MLPSTREKDTHHEEITDSHSNSSLNARSRKPGAPEDKEDGPATDRQPQY